MNIFLQAYHPDKNGASTAVAVLKIFKKHSSVKFLEQEEQKILQVVRAALTELKAN